MGASPATTSSHMMTPLAEHPPLSAESDVAPRGDLQRDHHSDNDDTDDDDTGSDTDPGPSETDTQDDDSDDISWPSTPPPGCLDPHKLPKELMLKTCVLEHRMLVPLLVRFVSFRFVS